MKKILFISLVLISSYSFGQNVDTTKFQSIPASYWWMGGKFNSLIVGYDTVNNKNVRSLAVVPDGMYYKPTNEGAWTKLASSSSEIGVPSVTNIAALQAYSGSSTSVIVEDSLRGGIFVYLSGVTEDDSGVYFTATGKGSGSWQRIYQGGINVKWFGAKGDGTTDDNIALQSAIDVAQSQPNPVLYISKGTYVTSVRLTATSNISIYGDGKYQSVIKGSASNTIILLYANGLTAPLTKFEIRNVGFDANGGGQLDAGTLTINSSFFTADNCWFANGSRAAIPSGVNAIVATAGAYPYTVGQIASGSITNCVFENYSKAPINWTTGAMDGIISHNIIKNCSGNGQCPGIQVNGGRRVVISDNIIDSIEGRGIIIATVGTATPEESYSVIVTGNHISNTGLGTIAGEGIAVVNGQANLYRPNNINISNNKVFNAGVNVRCVGIIVQNCDNVLVHGNTVNSSLVGGITFDKVTKITATGNTCVDVGDAIGTSDFGFYLRDVTRGTILNNRVIDTRATKLVDYCFTVDGVSSYIDILDNDIDSTLEPYKFTTYAPYSNFNYIKRFITPDAIPVQFVFVGVPDKAMMEFDVVLSGAGKKTVHQGEYKMTGSGKDTVATMVGSSTVYETKSNPATIVLQSATISVIRMYVVGASTDSMWWTAKVNINNFAAKLDSTITPIGNVIKLGTSIIGDSSAAIPLNGVVITPLAHVNISTQGTEPSLGADSLSAFSILSKNGSNKVTRLSYTQSTTTPFMGAFQHRHGSINGLSYPLGLQPLGGNVIIGSTSDDALERLQVTGKGLFTDTLKARGGLVVSNLRTGTGSDSFYVGGAGELTGKLALGTNLSVTAGVLNASGGSGVTTIGTFSSTSIANGASISGSTITLGVGDATNPGMVSTTTQTMAGQKTFTGAIVYGQGIQTSTAFNSNLYVANATSLSSTTSTAAYITGANNIQFRAGIRGNTSTVATAGSDVFALAIGDNNYTEAVSGTSALGGGLYVKTQSFVNGAGATTDFQNAYFGDAPTGGTNNWSINAGASQIRGILKVGAYTFPATDGTNNQVLTTNGSGNLAWSTQSGGSGITSLNALTGATQTFTNETNLTIVSAGTAHALTWAGTLADSRITSAATWNAKQDAITFGTGVLTALAVNVGTAGAFVVNGGAGGTPSAINLTNATAFPYATGGTGILPDANYTYVKSILGNSVSNGNTIALSTTNYMAIASSGGWNGGENARVFICPESGVLKNFYIVTNTAQPASGSLVLTIRKGTTIAGLSDESFTITVAANAAAGTFSNTSSTLSVTAGDIITIKGVNNATATSATVNSTSISLFNQ